MEINKQLFEDVLSGKLKGTFVLRSGHKFNSKCLKRTESTFLYHNPNYPYALVSIRGNGVSFASSYTENGIRCKLRISSYDVIDFIPDTNMKENELTIEIPDGKIVDWDESKKQNKIVFKDKQLTYEDIIKNAGIDYISNVHYFSDNQIKCLLAKNRLANVAKYLNDGWKPNEYNHAYYINNYHGNLVIWCSEGIRVGQIIFKSKKTALQAIEILGEETVKLALEPLGI